MDHQYGIIYCTAGSEEEADKVAQALLNQKAAACVNIVRDIKSIYWWQGKVDNSQEVLLLIKAPLEQFERIENIIKEAHSYDVPEIIAVPIVKGSKDYLRWVTDSVQGKG